MRLWLVSLILVSSRLWAQEDFEPFDLNELPPGAQLTLPHPAQMVAPLHMQLQIQANDRAQVLKLSTLALEGQTRTLAIAIYDRQSQRVRRLTLKPGAAVVYHFKSLQPIRIVPDLGASPKQWARQRLLLESNRPLGVSHGQRNEISSSF